MPPKSNSEICAIEDCYQPTNRRGWCGAHYTRWWKYGDPLFRPLGNGKILTPATERFWSKVDKNGPVVQAPIGACWLWSGSRHRLGYGYFNPDGRTMLAHHFLVGRPPKGLEWDHLCRTPACVRPEHLELVTHRVNMSRGFFAIKTHCPQGHEYTVENTRHNKKGRLCRACSRLSSS